MIGAKRRKICGQNGQMSSGKKLDGLDASSEGIEKIILVKSCITASQFKISFYFGSVLWHFYTLLLNLPYFLFHFSITNNFNFYK